MVGQVLTFNPSTVRIICHSEASLSHLKSSWLKGFLKHVVSDYVSIVNSQQYGEKLGIEVIEAMNGSLAKSEIEIEVNDDQGNLMTVGGVVYGERTMRISHIDSFRFEIPPKGRYLLVTNRDVPGVVGDVGGYLGNESINIGSMFLARKNSKTGEDEGKAMFIVGIDDSLSGAQTAKLMATKNVLACTQISF